VRRVLGLDEIRAAARRIEGGVARTPCVASETLSELAGARVFLKLENLQFTASFKERGALHKLLRLSPEERARGVIAMSAGNHALAVARHAGRLGVRATLVMPRYTPSGKVEHTRRAGAEVVLHGNDLSEAAAMAERLARERQLVFVHPYDDPDVVAGQGTVALEMLEQQPELDTLVVPVGGGGLAAGCALAARTLRPGIEVFGVESERFPSMRAALRGEPIVCGRDTVAEGIAVKQPGLLTREILRETLADILLVDEPALEEAVLLLLEVEKTVVEGAGAAALAALLRQRERFAGRRVGLVVSGGNIDLLVLSSIIERGLARSGRLARLRVLLSDQPGELARVAGVLAEAGVNVVELTHERSFGRVPLKQAQVDFVVAARGPDHLGETCARLRAAGYAVERPEGDT
jgi:threonine dehydratase